MKDSMMMTQWLEEGFPPNNDDVITRWVLISRASRAQLWRHWRNATRQLESPHYAVELSLQRRSGETRDSAPDARAQVWLSASLAATPAQLSSRDVIAFAMPIDSGAVWVRHATASKWNIVALVLDCEVACDVTALLGVEFLLWVCWVTVARASSPWSRVAADSRLCVPLVMSCWRERQRNEPLTLTWRI